MCGIVGYVGDRNAYPILIKGLHRLEYRGYDSAGFAMVGKSGDLNVYKCKGKVSALEAFVEGKDVEGSCGIAHTRWATHGEPNSVNAHPHYSCSENIAIIHNGIIENWALLKGALVREGYEFKSETDTEVLVNLIEYVRNTNKCSLLDAVRGALKQVIGAYAIAVVEKGRDDEIIVARQSSPLVVGIGEGEYFLASDATPIVEYTDKVVYLQDREIAVLGKNKPLKVVNFDNAECPIDVKKLEMNISELEKGGYKHFMLKEIHEQPKTIMDCLRGRLSPETYDVILSGVRDNAYRFLSARRIVIVACGTSWHASLIGEHLIEDLCRIPVEVEYASEFRYRNPVLGPDDVVIAVSQSGETADTLAAMSLAKAAGCFVFGICNVIGSSVARASDAGCYIHVGPEISVASTKAFTGQVTVFALIALTLANTLTRISRDRFEKLSKALLDLPDLVQAELETVDAVVKELAVRFKDSRDFIYMGRGYEFPVALEGALKLKEVSYIHADGYPAAEMKHGPIALIDKTMPVLAIAIPDELYEKTASNVQEVKARGGVVISVVSEDDKVVSAMSDYAIRIPVTETCLMPVLVSIPLQLFAYYIADAKGLDVDQPRNLAKSVTVE
ncbi:MAG: glutamine--fructose-6-phosphate transaminase (isomerizing) [Candidatus Cryptobacteroides sp.]